MVKITIGDVGVILLAARQNLIQHPDTARLPGMTRDLDLSEVRALAFVEAVTMFLNHKGAFKEGWLAANRADFHIPDSEPIEDADWDDKPPVSP